ncbi:MAG: peptide-N-glycosidase F-related protein [Hyphomicrobiales bacterium]
MKSSGPRGQNGLPALFLALLMAAIAPSGLRIAPAEADPTSPAPRTIDIFHDVPIRFAPDSAQAGLPRGVTATNDGRIVETTVTLPTPSDPVRLAVLLSVRPVPKSDREVFDRYDRAGSVRLAVDGAPDIEILRFITSYGGATEHEADVTYLAPLLRGRRTIRLQIDTWVSPAWRVDLALRVTPAPGHDVPSWAAPVYRTDDFNRASMPDGDSVTVTVPPGLARVVMDYTATGHCTDGIDADEFVSKANVISVDGVVVARFHPWRDDCRRFRDRNPYCARWTDGSWSSDYSRSGWCPGDAVLPTELDLTDHLTPGRHTIRFVIEDMRPKDAKGAYGYWRVAACLVGWGRAPDLWRNE